MALDPNIALAVRVAPFETRIQSPVDRYARMLSLRQLMQQQQTSEALEEERRQKAQLAREEAAREASFRGRFKAGQPMPTTAEAYGELGITGGAKYAEDLRKTATEQQATETARIKNEQARDAMLGQIAGGVLNANTQEGFERGIMDAGARDLISQEELHQLIGLRWDDPQTKAQVAQIARRGSEVEKQQAMDIAAAAEVRAQAEHPAKLAETKAKSLGEQLKIAAQSAPDNQTEWDPWYARLSPDLQQLISPMYSPTNRQRVLQSGLTAAERETGRRADATAARAALPNTVTELEFMATNPEETPARRAHAREALKLHAQDVIAGRPQTHVTLQPGYGSPTSKLTGEEFLATLSPAAANEIRGMAEGRLVAPTAASRASGAQQKLAALMQYDPGFSVQRAQMRKNLIAGPEGQHIGKGNTAIVHLGRLGDMTEAMDTGTFTPANEMYQYIKGKFGAETITNFELLKDAVAGEMAAALKGNATDVEIEKMGRSIRATNSPAAMRGVVKEGMGILSDKLKTYDERYHREMPDDPWSPILPSASDVLTRYNVPYKGAAGRKTGEATGGKSTAAPTVRAAKISTKEEYDKLPSGARFVDTQDGKTYIKR